MIKDLKIDHELKILPSYYIPTADGSKPFEIRYGDRDFKKGDIVKLREYEPEHDFYTGNELIVKITYITLFRQGVKDGYVVFGHSILARKDMSKSSDSTKWELA